MSAIATPGVVPLRLDVTNPDDVAAVVQTCGDLTLLVNNAGVLESGGLGGPDAVDAARRQIETNALGPLALWTALAPTLGANGGARSSTCCRCCRGSASRGPAATRCPRPPPGPSPTPSEWSWRRRGRRWSACTPASSTPTWPLGWRARRAPLEDVAGLALDAVEAGRPEVLVDDVSRMVRSRLADGLDALYPQLGAPDG